MKKIFVVCPANLVTGGPELLHQFVDSLNTQGADAYILYYPFDTNASVPDAYQKYDLKIGNYEEVKSNIVVLSEINTNMSALFPMAKVNIWWLSVDFFLGVYKESKIMDSIRYFYTLLFRRVPIKKLMNHQHWVQSEYAKNFLRKNKIESNILSDYINQSHFQEKGLVEKKNIILYNPKKGQKKTQKLIKNNPELKFIPIQNMTAIEVQNLFKTAKIYIDFGNHPGKDRMPREAVLAGCCIITGRQGSAKNSIDIPIDNKYKFNDCIWVNNKEFSMLASDIFANYQHHLKFFHDYRTKILQEKQNFIIEVNNFIKITDSSLK
jgi:hypothetical protein